MLQSMKYRTKPKVVFIVMKAQGDIQIELRDLDGAINTYKSLVLYQQ